MIIERAQVEDAQEILGLQKLAYSSEAEIYNDYTIPPLTQTLDDIRDDFEIQTFLKASLDGRIVGSVRAYMRQDTCFVGRLIVHPEFQNRGIGTRLMSAIESCFSPAQRFELFTGKRSARNIYLYQKLGYRIFRNESLTEHVTLVYLEKFV